MTTAMQEAPACCLLPPAADYEVGVVHEGYWWEPQRGMFGRYTDCGLTYELVEVPCRQAL